MPSPSTARISLPDRYRVIRHLANGGMASVWEAHDELLGRDVAVKVLATHLGEDDAARRRFAREARAAAGLSHHPNVVTIYDVGEHDGHTYMVMELMRGGSLADRLRSGREVSREDALRWLGEAAAALDAAHDAGVVHRDVKPANMLLDERGRLAIGDFGIARVAETTAGQQLTATGQVLGTAAYISPEQAVGEPATAASDRYALAVVAYELLTGGRPFRGDTFAAQARAHVEDEPEPPSQRRPGLPAAVDAVLLHGLAKDPEDRWPTATEMVGRLDDAVDTPPTEPTRPLVAPQGRRREPPPPPPPVGDQLPVRRRRGRGALLAALAGLIVVAIAAAVLLTNGNGGSSGSGKRRAANQPTPTATKSHPKQKKTPTPTPTPTPTTTPTPTATPTETTTPTTTPTPSSSGGTISDARTLQQRGFAAGNAGDYATDLRLSRRALSICGNTQQLDPCGYADYEVGRSLNHLGQPEAAIPYLKARLAYGASPDAQRELQSAQQAAGASGASAPPPGNGHGKAKGHGKD